MGSMRSDMSYNSNVLRMTQALAFTGSRNGAPSRLKAFIAAIAIVWSTRSRGSKAAAAAASASSEAFVSLDRTSVALGGSVSVRLDSGGRRNSQKKKNNSDRK